MKLSIDELSELISIVYANRRDSYGKCYDPLYLKLREELLSRIEMKMRILD